jgi:hypothetical protein
MDIKDIKKRYEEAYIEDFGDYEIVHVDKNELDWLIEQAEKVKGLENVIKELCGCLDWHIEACERYEKALKAYGDEEGEIILKALEERK